LQESLGILQIYKSDLDDEIDEGTYILVVTYMLSTWLRQVVDELVGTYMRCIVDDVGTLLGGTY
jgi:hypothetical protein